MQSADLALERLCDPAAEVSAHYLIGIDGTVWQLVEENMRAWHAGAGAWKGMDDINSRSVGIELDNRGDHPFPEAQIEVLENLLQGIMARWKITPEGIIGHSDMAPGRKRDPGPRFDWARLERRGLARRPAAGGPTAEVSPDAFRTAAVDAGYPNEASDEGLLEATRLRLRQGATGPLVQQDLDALFSRKA